MFQRWEGDQEKEETKTCQLLSLTFTDTTGISSAEWSATLQACPQASCELRQQIRWSINSQEQPEPRLPEPPAASDMYCALQEWPHGSLISRMVSLVKSTTGHAWTMRGRGCVDMSTSGAAASRRRSPAAVRQPRGSGALPEIGCLSSTKIFVRV